MLNNYLYDFLSHRPTANISRIIILVTTYYKNNTRRMKSLHAARFIYLESLLLVQSPGKAVFCIFYLKAKVG